MLEVEQLFLVTFTTDEIYNRAVERLRGGVPWSAADGRQVFGWPSSDSLLQVRLTNLHPDVPQQLLVDLLKNLGRVGFVHRAPGRDPLFPMAFDGILHLKMAVDEASVLPDFIAVETAAGVLDCVVRVYTDNSKKRCFQCGCLGHIGPFCRRATRSRRAQGRVWARVVLPAAEDEAELLLFNATADQGGGAGQVAPRSPLRPQLLTSRAAPSPGGGQGPAPVRRRLPLRG